MSFGFVDQCRLQGTLPNMNTVHQWALQTGAFSLSRVKEPTGWSFDDQQRLKSYLEELHLLIDED